MKLEIFEKWAQVGVPAEVLWDWHMRPGAFERLSPPWQRLVPLRLPSKMTLGGELRLELRVGPLRKGWTARIDAFEPPRRFIDTQVSGPFAQWTHEHLMESKGSDSSVLVDRIRYDLPFKLRFMPFASMVARGQLERLFHFRHERMITDLQRYSGRKVGQGKTLLVTGSTGLVGSRIVPFLETLGYRVRGLTRRPSRKNQYAWNPAKGKIDPKALAGVDGVLHLAGENIAAKRWTEEQKELILKSRVQGTRTLVQAMRKMRRPPGVFISASGVNIYPNESQLNDESSPLGEGFLSDVCQQWEHEAMQAQKAGIRTVCVRTGVVLDPLGGALGKMLPAFRLGLGGRVGSGLQGFPWIGMDDLLDILELLIREDTIEGPVNAVHPQIVTQKEFSKCLARVLGRPALVPLPEFLVNRLFGEMGQQTLLSDLTVTPAVLLEKQHRFRHPDLASTLAFILGK